MLTSWQNGEIWAGSADAQDATVRAPQADIAEAMVKW